MITCAICQKDFKDLRSLGKHIFYSHKHISKKEYYDAHIKEMSPICICGKEKKFRGLGEGYRDYCSVKCRSENIEPTKFWLGKKQPKSVIDKRIKNTNQKEKERKRKNTMIEKYGVDNPSFVPEFAEKMKLRSKPLPPRKKEHSDKIVESKRKNNTLKHSKSTRKRISETLEKYYQNGDDQSVVMGKIASNGRGHLVGKYKGILYRSSYELTFLVLCDKFNIEVESCENKERRVRYIYKGKKRWYYPDFYLPKLDICVEIKPSSMMNEIFHIKKEFAEKIYNRYIVITEKELTDEELLYEYLLPTS